MKAFLALTGLSFKNLLLTTMNSGAGKKKGRKVSSAGALILLGAIMLYISLTFSFSLLGQLAPLGLYKDVFSLMITMAVLMPFFLTFLTAQGSLFSTKDADLVFSLPVSSFSVLLARLCALYIEILFMCELFLLPFAFAWLRFVGGGAGFVLALIFLGIFLAMIPTTAALIAGFIISLLTSKMKHKNLFMTILSLALMAAIFYASFSLSGLAGRAQGLDETSVLPEQFSLGINFLPADLLYAAITGSITKLLIFLALCIVPFFSLTWLLSLSYKKIITGFLSKHSGSVYKHKELNTSGSFAALIKKEALRFFTTPAYIMNHGISIIMTVAACVIALINKAKIAEFAVVLEVSNEVLFAAALCLLMFLLSMIMPASVSLSLEGKTLWILKSMPVSAGQIFASKAGLNFAVQGSTAILALIMLQFVFNASFLNMLTAFIFCMCVCAAFSMLAMICNLWFPKMDAANDTAVIKNSASVIVCMLLSLVLIVAFTALFIFLYAATGLSFALSLLICSAVMALLAFLLKTYMLKKGAKLLAEIN